jgi:hypothetical protein
MEELDHFAFTAWKETTYWRMVSEESTPHKKKKEKARTANAKAERVARLCQAYQKEQDEKEARAKREEKQLEAFLKHFHGPSPSALRQELFYDVLIPVVHSGYLHSHSLFNLSRVSVAAARAVRALHDFEWRQICFREFRVAFTTGIPMFSLEEMAGKWRRYCHHNWFGKTILQGIILFEEFDSEDEYCDSSEGSDDEEKGEEEEEEGGGEEEKPERSLPEKKVRSRDLDAETLEDSTFEFRYNLGQRAKLESHCEQEIYFDRIDLDFLRRKSPQDFRLSSISQLQWQIEDETECYMTYLENASGLGAHKFAVVVVEEEGGS